MSYILHNSEAWLVGSASKDFGVRTNTFIDGKQKLRCKPLEFQTLSFAKDFRDKVVGVTMCVKERIVLIP